MEKILIVFLFIISLGLRAQTPVQNFKLTNVVDGSTVSLESYPACAGLAILFTSNACPYDGYYVARIKDLIDTHQGKIQFLLVNSFQETEEAIDQMKDIYARWGLPVPYLTDKEQEAMTCLGAKKSPEVFLLKNMNGKYTVVYSGAIDDNPQVANAVTQPYLKTAIDKMLAGQKIDPPMVRAVGCSIRKK